MKRLRNPQGVTGLVVELLLIGAAASTCKADLSGWIAFGEDGDIWAVRANGNPATRTQLVNMPGGQGEPEWSPDSRKIVYAYESEAQIWVYDWFNGTNTKIYDGDNYGGQFSVGAPAWSPNGSKILFCEQTTYNNPHITVINANGTGRAVVPVESGYVNMPSWSQTGTAFVYTKRGGGTASDDL
jgi:Tol biopolymer transport system component